MPRIYRPAMERFVSRCKHNPMTDCVEWMGGTTSGRGHSSPYGAFWFEGRRWFAHRWAARYIHGLDIEGLQVDHCCPHMDWPNTLCVQHLQAIPAAANRELQWTRAQVGLDEPPPTTRPHEFTIPFVDEPIFPDPPAWLIRLDGFVS